MSPKRDGEVKALGDWCKVVLEFHAQVSPSPLVSEMDDVLALAVEQRHVAHLKAIRRHLSEWIGGLSPTDQAAIRTRIEALANRPAEMDEALVIRRVLERGVIETQDEYETLRTWLDYADQGTPAQDLERVDTLIMEYGGPISG